MRAALIAALVALCCAAQAQTVRVGGRQVDLAGGVFDPRCEQPVAPFALTANIEELARHGLDAYAEQQLPGALDKALGKKPPRRPAGKGKGAPITPALRLAAKRMNWLPMSVEDAYGEQLLRRMRGRLMPREGRVGPRWYPAADALLAEVLAGVKQPHAYRFEAFISTEAGENAMALPGGRIVIDKALLEDPALHDKAVFAVAHEVGHVLQRHQTRALQARVIDALALKASLPDLIKTLRNAGGQPQAVLRLLVGGKLLFEKHSEQQELQADACGMRLLDEGGGDAGRLLAAVAAFAQGLPAPQPAPPPDDTLGAVIDLVQRPVDAHPSTPERRRNLDQMLAELGQRPGAKRASRPRVEPLPTLPGRR